MYKKEYRMSDMEEQDLNLAPSLDLPALRIEKWFLPKDGGKLMLIFANVRKDWRPKGGCPICHRKDTIVLSGRASKPRIVRDITRNNYCVQIAMQSQRMACTDCHYRFNPTVDGIVENGTMTERLLDFVKVESFLQPHTDVAERTGLSIQTVQKIMDAEIDRLEEERRLNPIVAPRVLGIDEKHITNVMRGTIVDVENGNLLDMVENNEEDSMRGAIEKLKDWDKNIKVVTTDMANSYLSWMPGMLPNATFVIDKFHVVQDIAKRVTTAKNVLYPYRKSLIEKIEDKTERARQFEILHIVNDNKRLFNYSMENIQRNEKRALKLDTVMDEFPEFRLLRILYYYIEELYNQQTRKDAEAIWDEWQEVLPPTGKRAYREWCDLYSVDEPCFEAFKTFKRAGFTQFKPYILNYFNEGCRFTNATTEGLNNLIGRINIAGNGYRFKHLRAKALYASLIYKSIQYSMDVNSIDSWKPTMSFETFGSGFGGYGGYDDYYSRPRKYKYDFRKKTVKLHNPPTNVLTDNSFFISTLAGDDEFEELPDIDEDSVIQNTWFMQ